jgi:hypothetical protein
MESRAEDSQDLHGLDAVLNPTIFSVMGVVLKGTWETLALLHGPVVDGGGDFVRI